MKNSTVAPRCMGLTLACGECSRAEPRLQEPQSNAGMSEEPHQVQSSKQPIVTVGEVRGLNVVVGPVQSSKQPVVAVGEVINVHGIDVVVTKAGTVVVWTEVADLHRTPRWLSVLNAANGRDLSIGGDTHRSHTYVMTDAVGVFMFKRADASPLVLHVAAPAAPPPPTTPLTSKEKEGCVEPKHEQQPQPLPPLLDETHAQPPPRQGRWNVREWWCFASPVAVAVIGVVAAALVAVFLAWVTNK